MKYLVLLIAPFAIAITVAPGIEVEVVNKTTLTIVTDVVVAVKVNNTALSQHLGEDVYTIAVLHLRFNCGAKGEKTMHYVFQNPQNTATLSLSQTLMYILLCAQIIYRYAGLFRRQAHSRLPERVHMFQRYARRHIHIQW